MQEQLLWFQMHQTCSPLWDAHEGQISLKQSECTPALGVTLTIKFSYYSFRKLSCFERVQAWMWMMN